MVKDKIIPILTSFEIGGEKYPVAPFLIQLHMAAKRSPINMQTTGNAPITRIELGSEAAKKEKSPLVGVITLYKKV